MSLTRIRVQVEGHNAFTGSTFGQITSVRKKKKKTVAVQGLRAWFRISGAPGSNPTYTQVDLIFFLQFSEPAAILCAFAKGAGLSDLPS